MREPYPWNLGTLRQPASGLRDTVLRVQYLHLSDCRRLLAIPLVRSRQSEAILNCCEWRLRRPTLWDELLVVLGIAHRRQAPQKRSA